VARREECQNKITGRKVADLVNLSQPQAQILPQCPKEGLSGREVRLQYDLWARAIPHRQATFHSLQDL
jgi:hypothetical protein